MSALRLLVLLSLAIFCGEFAIMLTLDHLRIENELLTNIVDSTALVIIVFPFLYFFVLRTIVAKNGELTAAHREVVAAKGELEERIKERTNEITVANRELKQTVDRLNLRRAEMSRLSEVVNFFQACRNLDEAFALAETQWQSLFPGVAGTLYLMKASHNFLEKAVSWGDMPGAEPCHAPDECWALRRGKRHLTGGPDGMVPCRHLSADGGHRYVCMPLSAHGETLGTLCLQLPEESENEHGNIGRRKNDQIEYHAAAAESLALAISNLRLRETLRYQAVRDQLTGLYNRRYLIETLERELVRAATYDQHVSVLMMDIDHFKRFNDTFGHAAGDAVLARLGVVLREWKRGEDIVARYGGEEIAVVLSDTSESQALERIELLRQAIRAMAVEHHGQLLPPVTISGGIASYPDRALDRDSLLNIADEALYRAKHEGRDRICVADATAPAPQREPEAARSGTARAA